MNKIILQTSFGKDSLSTYLKLVELHGKNSVIPVTFKSNVKMLWDPAYEQIINEFGNTTIIDCGNTVYYEALNEFMLENNIDASNCYLSTGEIDNIDEICNYYSVIRKYNYKGWINPYFGKPKETIFDILNQYECEFLFTRAVIPDESFRIKAEELIGTVITTNDLKILYKNDPFLFYSMQTIATKCTYFKDIDYSKINNYILQFNENKNLTEYIVTM